MNRGLVGKPIDNRQQQTDSNIRTLERRINHLERLLSQYTEHDIIGIDPLQSNLRQRYRILAINGPTEGEEDLTINCQLGDYRNGGITSGYVFGGGKTVQLNSYLVTQQAGRSVWIKATWTAQAIDDVLQPGGTMGSVSIHHGANIPTDNVPNINNLSGTAYYVIYGWDSEGNPISTGCGPVHIDFCPGGFIKTRGHHESL